MKKQIHAQITCPLPYPVSRDYHFEATNIGAGAKIAWQQFRKEIKGKKITEATIRIKVIGKVPNEIGNSYN